MAFLVLASVVSQVKAVTLYNNLQGVNSVISVTTNLFLAMGTSLGINAFSLDSATLTIGKRSDDFYLSLHSDNSGKPGSLLLAPNATTPFTNGVLANYSFVPTSPFTLAANSTYWLIASGNGPFSLNNSAWARLLTTAATDPSITSAGYRTTTDAGNTWNDTPTAIRTLCIEGTIFTNSISVTNYMAGHSDVAVSYVDGDWDVHYRFGGDTILNGSLATITTATPETIHVIVPNNASTRIVLNSNQVNGAYSFLGTTAGQTNWYISQSTVSGEPFFGLGTDELQYEQFTGPITFRLSSFSGPGNVSAWQNDTFGNPIIGWTTANGLGDDDVIGFGVPTHAHYSWGFTAPGEYVLGVTVTGTNITNGVLTSTKNIVFEVAPFAVPSLTIQQNVLSDVVISLPTIPSQLYQLQSATNVAGPWNSVRSQFTGSGLTNQITRTNTLNQEFFRIQTQP